MNINRLKKLSGLTESVDLEEQVGNEGLLRAALQCLQACKEGDTSSCDEVISAIEFELDGPEYYDPYPNMDHRY